MYKVCSEKIEELNLMADNMLTGDELEAVSSHLETCAACRGYLNDIRALKASVAGLEINVPYNLSEKISMAVRREAVKRERIRKLYYASSFAAACIVVAFSFYLSGAIGGFGSKTSESLEADRYAGSTEQGMLSAPEDNSIKGMGSDTAEVPAPEPLPELALDAESLDNFEYYASALADGGNVIVNQGNSKLDYGFEGMQDVFYATRTYTSSEAMEILENEFGVRPVEITRGQIFFEISTGMLSGLETRLDLVSSGVLEKDKGVVTVRIVSITE
ncbi:MAG: zf-HC2 domain-containing protein [Clostridia bacterium]|nr:zf-HC2 domain-containing protein [Clostridia bacterium]